MTNKPIQVQFAVPANLDDLTLAEARVHIGFVAKSFKNSWMFQYADGSRRTMNKSKWVLHGSLIGARASLRKLLEAKHAAAVEHVQYIEYLMEGDML
ncbi:MAG: hypothetical protein ACRCZO_16190 [Cetobacterium sp.]